MMMDGRIIYGTKTDKHLNPNESLGLRIYNELQFHGSKIAQTDGVTGYNQTYDDILNSSCVLAHNLQSRGIRNGDVISLCSANRLEFTVPLIATLYIGVICAPVNPAYKTDELIHCLNITKPKLIFCSMNTYKTVSSAVKRCPFIAEIVLFGNIIPHRLPYKVTMFNDLQKPSYPCIRADNFKPAKFDSYLQTAVILCSSGTTGLPKGVKLSHANVEAFVEASRNRYRLGLGERDVLMGLVPFFHGYGYGMILNNIIIGLKLIILPKFEENLFLSSIERYKITKLPLVPPLMVFLSKHPLVNKYDYSSVKDIFCGAAPCGLNTIEEVIKRLKLKEVRQTYGMTELSFLITITPENSNKLDSVGKLVEDSEGKVIDVETGTLLGPNKVGELCFRGAQLMQGYHNNPNETSEMIDSDGWLHTGDLGYYDEDEFFYIVDRLKELIKYKGYQVAPAELEALILSHQDVKDVAVIGIPDEASGELPMAFVVKQPGSNISESDVIEFVASKVSSQKKLRGGVRFIDAIPKNPSGKILRRVLRSNLK